MRVAALFVDPRGPYWNRPDVDAWDERRDARAYTDTLPVVAHPPCERWGRYWSGGPSAKVRHAFKRYGLEIPPKTGTWIAGAPHEQFQTWLCCVEQGHYGHPARKATWLYYVGKSQPPELIWGPSAGQRLDEGFHSKAERIAARAAGQKPVKRLSTMQNLITPHYFAELLINLARNSARY